MINSNQVKELLKSVLQEQMQHLKEGQVEEKAPEPPQVSC